MTGSIGSPSYPREREADVVLRDGSNSARPARPSRRGGRDLRVPHDGLGQSIAFRFLGAPNLECVVAWSVDVDYVVVPAERVLDAARQCAEAGVRALVVISAGFAETGEEGARRQHELLSICRDAGMRLAAVEDVLLMVSALVEAHPAIVELDCNPLIARPDGAVIVDARVRV